MQIKVSVIVPLYNAEPFLSRCIQSVLSQTWKAFELILVDDGSTDGSGAVCRKAQEQDARIVCLRQENKGVSAARNQGIDAARGEFVTFLDADDWLDPHYLERMLAAQERFHSDLTSCEHADISAGSGKSRIGRVFPGERYAEGEDFSSHIIPKIFYNNGGQPLCDPYCHLFKKEILDTCHIRYDETLKLREGRLFNFMYAQHCSRFYYLPEPLYFRLLRNGSALHAYRENIYQECRNICAAYTQLLRRFHQTGREDAHFCIDALINLVFYSNLRYPENQKSCREIQREYDAFLRESPMKELWKQVRLSQCRDLREIIQVVCVKLRLTALLRWIYRLRMKWTGRQRAEKA